MDVQASSGLEENVGSSQSDTVDVAIEMPTKESNDEAAEEPESSINIGDTDAVEGNGAFDTLDKLKEREAIKSFRNELTQQLRIIGDCSEEDRYRASPGNRLDEILEGEEDRWPWH